MEPKREHGKTGNKFFDEMKVRKIASTTSLPVVGRPVNVTELHLAGRRIKKIDELDSFDNLEVLWINNNKLTELTGLDTNFRLRALFAHENRINTLEGSLKHLAFLTELTLYDNELRDLHAMLPYLKHLKFLKSLDMRQNPLSQEHNYRLHMIHHLPNLHVLDRHQVTAEEREAAARLLGHVPEQPIAFMQKKPDWKAKKHHPFDETGRPVLSSCAKDMYSELGREQAKREAAAQAAQAAAFGAANQSSAPKVKRRLRPSKDLFSCTAYVDAERFLLEAQDSAHEPALAAPDSRPVSQPLAEVSQGTQGTGFASKTHSAVSTPPIQPWQRANIVLDVHGNNANDYRRSCRQNNRIPGAARILDVPTMTNVKLSVSTMLY